jgi:hypothetical protein
MPTQVVMGAVTQCSFGMLPSVLNVIPTNRVFAPTPAATIADHIPGTNIVPFGMCTSLGKPDVAKATAEAGGVLVPQPCQPATPAPWIAGATSVLIGGIPALDNISKCACTFGGVISIVSPGQMPMQIP